MPWRTQDGFRYKNMEYTNSCFPCCFHVILRNMKKINEDAAVENLWNQMQIQNTGQDLNAGPPNENDVHRNLASMPQTANVNRMKILTPSVFAALNPNNMRDLQGLINTINVHEIRNNYQGMIIGNAHATVVFKLKTNRYIHFSPSPTLNTVQLSRASTITISPAVDFASNTIIGILARGLNRNGEVTFAYGGDFVVMIG